MNKRLICAILFAPLAAAVVLVVDLSLFWESFRPISIQSVATGFLSYAAFAYVVEFTLGLPAFRIYRDFSWQNPVGWGFGGAFLGFLAMLIPSIIFSSFMRSTPAEFFLCIAAGMIAGLAFRLIAGDGVKNRVRTHLAAHPTNRQTI
jgi:hypothetical protein